MDVLHATDYQVDFILGENPFRELAEEWNDLYTRTECHHVAQSFGWNWSAWEALVKPAGGQICCTTVRQGGRLNLVWPMALFRHRVFWSRAAPAGPSEWVDVLAESRPDSSTLATLAWQKFRKSCPSDLVFVDPVATRSLLYHALADEQPLEAQKKTSFHTNWEGHDCWETFYTTLSKKFRSNVERSQRRLAEQGQVTFEVVQNEESAEEIIKWILKTKKKWLCKVNRPSLLVDSKNYERFLLLLLNRIRPHGTIRLFTMKIDANLVASDYCVNTNSGLEYTIGAYNPQYEKYSAGLILHLWAMKWAYERRLVYNMGVGWEKYKETLSNGTTELVDMRFANTTWGRLFMSLRSSVNLLWHGLS